MSEYVICNICKQRVKIRKTTSMGSLPVQHQRYYGGENCHGFYIVSNTYPNDEEKLCPFCGSTPYGAGCQNCPPCNR